MNAKQPIDLTDQNRSKRIKLNLINGTSNQQRSSECEDNQFPLDKQCTVYVPSIQNDKLSDDLTDKLNDDSTNKLSDDLANKLIDQLNPTTSKSINDESREQFRKELDHHKPLEFDENESNMSISSNSSVSSLENTILNEKLAKSFPNFYNKQSNDQQSNAKPNVPEDLNTVHIPGILDKPSTSDRNIDLISKIESLKCDQNCVNELSSSLDSEHSSIDSFLDLNSINQINKVILDDPELFSLLLDNDLPDLFLGNELQENNGNSASQDDDIQIVDEKESKEFELDDSTLNRVIRMISKENNVSQETVRNIIVQYLKGNTAVFISRFELSDLQFETATVSKVVKDFNYLKKLYQFRCWKKAVALSSKKRFDEFGRELIDQCLSYERMALIYYLYFVNAESDVYLNDDLALKILTNQQLFDSTLKSKIPNHQNSEQKLYQSMIKMVSHYLSKNKDLINYLINIKERPTLFVKLAGIKSTSIIQQKDKYRNEIIIDQASPVDLLKLVYEEQSQQVKFLFNCDKIKKGAHKLLTELYQSAEVEILEDAFEDCWSYYFENSLSCYFRYEIKYRCLRLLKNDLQIKLKTLLQRSPYSKITILGIEPIGHLNSESLQYAIRINDEIILNNRFDLNNSNESFKQLFFELYKDYEFSIVVIPTSYFSSRIRSLMHEVLMTELVSVKNQIIVVDASKDNELIENMTSYDRVAYYINRLSDPLRQWIFYRNFMTLPDCEYFKLMKDNLNEILTDQFNECISLLPIDVNVEALHVLQYVNGLNEKLATEIVNYREKKIILNRKQLKEINGMTEEIYRQSVAFLFINKKSIQLSAIDNKLIDSYDPYDSTIIHPEFYEDADKILEYLNLNKNQLGTSQSISAAKEFLNNFSVDQLARNLKINLVRVKIVFNALLRPLNYDYRINLSI